MNDHITEEQIQDYLDKQDSINTSDIEKHLQICSSCQKNLAEYQELYTVLNSDPFPELPKDFSTQVLSAVSDTQESRKQLFESGSIMAFFLFGIAASLYFVNPLPFLTNVITNMMNHLGEYASQFLPELNGNIAIYIAAILIFLLVEIVDKKILKPRL
jgi:hypothetical protein